MVDGGRIGAVVLAAGQSRRMGRPKMVLPWGTTTVIGQVVNSLHLAEISPILVITGGAESQVVSALAGLPVLTVHNSNYLQSEMVYSLQLGLRAMPEDIDAVLVCLGDQPQIETAVILMVAEDYRQTQQSLVIPSYQMRRGHPWLVSRDLWGEILTLDQQSNLRQFMQANQEAIGYVNVSSGSILKDLDTPEDYSADAPQFTA